MYCPFKGACVEYIIGFPGSGVTGVYLSCPKPKPYTCYTILRGYRHARFLARPAPGVFGDPEP